MPMERLGTGGMAPGAKTHYGRKSRKGKKAKRSFHPVGKNLKRRRR